MRTFLVLVFWFLLGALATAHAACVPTETTERRIVLAWPALEPDVDHTLTAWRLQRTGDLPAILPPLAPEALTMTDTVEPGAHAWQLIAEFTRVADGATVLSDRAPLGTPPPCVVVHAVAPPPPVLTSLHAGTTFTGVTGMDLRWTLEGADRPVRLERRPDDGQAWAHVGSVPGGFFFDFFALTPGTTYCYRACLLNVDPPPCSAERCAAFPPAP